MSGTGSAPVATVGEVIDLHDGRPPLQITRPASSEALIDERAFADDEYLPYWAELWPSALALARVVGRQDLSGRRVLEVGCGLAVPALAAARSAATVLATDWAPDAVQAARANAAANGLPLQTAVTDWRDARAIAAAGPFDLILAADVLYEARNIPPLLELIRVLAAPRILLADPSRATAEPFLAAVTATHTVTTTPSPRPAVLLHDLRPR